MPFVYHLCAPDFRGSVLYPLDGLKPVFPDLHARERVKYEGRESVLGFVVPGLGVTWGATVNLSALDPAHLVTERRRLGVPFSNLLTRQVLRIPIERLAGLPAVRYNSKTHWINSSPGDPSVPATPPATEFEPLSLATYQEVAAVPPLHTEYLQRQLSRGDRALGFVFVPHVLVAAAIDVAGLRPEPLL
ncbi:MAG: hypothetical protein HY021_15050 [Burkholderiales bacterium]|nr:hypothetical protein [Burkholderiales bacterium]